MNIPSSFFFVFVFVVVVVVVVVFVKFRTQSREIIDILKKSRWPFLGHH